MDQDQWPEHQRAEFRQQIKFIQRLAVAAVEQATNGDDIEYGVFTFRADATGFKGGDAGHGGHAVVTIENDAGSLALRLCFDGQHNFDTFIKEVARAQSTGSHELTVELYGGDSMTVVASGDWEQGELTNGLARCFVKLAKILGWSGR